VVHFGIREEALILEDLISNLYCTFCSVRTCYDVTVGGRVLMIVLRCVEGLRRLVIVLGCMEELALTTG
jgi:hypothetical protein